MSATTALDRARAELVDEFRAIAQVQDLLADLAKAPAKADREEEEAG
jgi:hypothetical protein